MSVHKSCRVGRLTAWPAPIWRRTPGEQRTRQTAKLAAVRARSVNGYKLTVLGIETITVSNSNTHDNSLQRVEAVLFLSRTPLTSRRVAQLADLEDGTQARTLIAKLNENYREKGRAFHVKRVAGGYQIRTKPIFSRWLRQLDIPNHYQRLTTPALETLTVVAYRQPIIKADIEAIRGVGCGEMLRQLLEKGLVRIVGRSEQLGHPFLYGTTKKFLTDFGLNNLDSLPQEKFLRGAGLPQGLSFDQNSSNGVSEPKQVDNHHPVHPMVSKEDTT